jgi:phosphoesterase RecJ-like protein
VTELERAMAAAARAIESADTIIAIGHVHPDGDALGSALALARAARAAGKQAWATFGEPFTLGDQFRYLDTDAAAAPGDLADGADVVVACDTANPERLGSALPLAESAGTLVVVDHHVSNGGFGDIVVVDPAAAATAQLMYRLLADHLRWPIDAATATALYTGLVTDTGRFQYSSTDAEVHRIAAALLEAGVDPDGVGRHVYGEAPFGYLLAAGAVLTRCRLVGARRLVWSVMYRSDLTDAGIGYDDTDGLIDLVRLAAEAEVACLLKETGDGVFKGSLRSRGTVDVNAVASAFGGGGHHNAAGFTATGKPDEIVARVEGLLS